MNFKRFMKSVVDSVSKSTNRPASEEGAADSGRDILEQNSFRLIYPLHQITEAHSENYERAFQLAEKFAQLDDYLEKIRFWHSHATVFNVASVLCFDTLEQTYGYCHGQPLNSFGDEFAKNPERYRLFNVFPTNYKDFRSFMTWCILNRRNKVEVWTIMDEAYYWKQIGKSKAPTLFLTNLLNAAETHSKRVSQVYNPFAGRLLKDEEAKDCYFYYGTKDAIDGVSEGNFGSASRLFEVFQNIITCPISTYGDLFFQYSDGHHTIEMINFLSEQKKRLEKGEDITLPADNGIISHIEEEKEESTEVVLTLTQIAFMYHIKGMLITKNNNDEIARQYGYTSGQKLQEKFNQYEDPEVRTGEGKNTITNYLKIIPLLSGRAKELAEKELSKAKRKNKK